MNTDKLTDDKQWVKNLSAVKPAERFRITGGIASYTKKMNLGKDVKYITLKIKTADIVSTESPLTELQKNFLEAGLNGECQRTLSARLSKEVVDLEDRKDTFWFQDLQKRERKTGKIPKIAELAERMRSAIMDSEDKYNTAKRNFATWGLGEFSGSQDDCYEYQFHRISMMEEL